MNIKLAVNTIFYWSQLFSKLCGVWFLFLAVCSSSSWWHKPEGVSVSPSYSPGSCRGGVRGSFSSFTAASLHVLSSIHDGINPCSVPCFPASFSPGLTECYVTILHHLLLSVSSASLFLSYPNSITLSFAVSFLCLTLFHPSYHCTSLQNPPPPLAPNKSFSIRRCAAS